MFSLTDHGTQFVEDYLVDTDEAPDAYAVKIDRALDEIGKLRGTVEDLERTVEQQASEIEKLREERDDALDELRGDLEDAPDSKRRSATSYETTRPERNSARDGSGGIPSRRFGC